MDNKIKTDGRKKPRTAAQIKAFEKAQARKEELKAVGGRNKNDDPATVKRSRTVTINERTELFLLEKTGLKTLSQVLEVLANQFRES
jgi:hypothetical protein